MAKFQPGNQAAVGNGRPRLDRDFKERCRAAVDAECVQKWIDEVRNMGEHWVKCSELLAAYGYGKPAQAVEVTGKDGGAIEVEQMEKLSVGELRALIATTDVAPVTH